MVGTVDCKGSTVAGQGRAAEATGVFRNAAKFSPSDPDAVAELGWSLIRAGQFEEAEMDVKRSRKLLVLSIGAVVVISILFLLVLYFGPDASPLPLPEPK